MKTPAKKSCAFCPTPVHHMSVLHVLAHEMQLEALWGNRAVLLKCNYGESCDNLGELGRAAEICVDLWGAVESVQRKENAWTCNVSASDFRIVLFFGRCFPMTSHWNQMASNGLTREGGTQDIPAPYI